MSRSRTTSRALIGVLVVTIILGAVAYFHNPNRTKANEKLKDAQAAKTAEGGNTQVAMATPTPTPRTEIPDPSKTAGQVNTGQINLGSAGSKAMITTTPGGASKPEDKPAIEKAAIEKTGTEKVGVDKAAVEKPAVDKVVAITGALKASDKPATPSRTTGNALAEGKAKIEANDLVNGRSILNEALINGSFSAADAVLAKELIAKANETLIFSPRRVAEDTYTSVITVAPGQKPMKIAAACDVTWDFLGRINNISDARKLRAGQTLKTVKGPFHVVVTKSTFTMDVFLGSPGEKGSMYVRSFKVGLGKHGSTPTGTWMVAPQSKLKNPKWWGTADEPAKEADDPANPLGEFWIGLQGTDGDAVGKQGFGIHGTIEPDTIGKEMSHGCVRLVAADIERVYEMLVDGKSTVIIKE